MDRRHDQRADKLEEAKRYFGIVGELSQTLVLRNWRLKSQLLYNDRPYWWAPIAEHEQHAKNYQVLQEHYRVLMEQLQQHLPPPPQQPSKTCCGWLWPAWFFAVALAGYCRSPTLQDIALNAAELYKCDAFWYFAALLGKILVFLFQVAGYNLPLILEWPWYGWLLIWACLLCVAYAVCTWCYNFAVSVGKFCTVMATIILFIGW